MSRHILKGIPHRQREQLYEKLETLYRELDRDYESLPKPCTQCGKCCLFQSFGHKLYISSLEFEYAYENLPKPDKVEEGNCPYLVDKSCTARQHRMLGCRTFFRLHTEKEEEEANMLYEKYLRQIKKIYKDHGLPWEYKDLLVYVQEAFE